jgi:Mg2+/Co2+ transporter CorB
MEYQRSFLTLVILVSLSISVLLASTGGEALNFTGIFLFVLLILSGIFSGSEVALLSLSHGKVHTMLEEKLAGAKAVEKLKSNSNRMLIVILIGNNLVNIGASVLTTAWASHTFGDEVLGVVTGVLTILILVFGEIFPKVFAQKYADRVSLIVAKPLLVLQFIFMPVIWILEIVLKFTNKFAGESKNPNSSLAEIKALVKLASHQGHIGIRSKNIISNSLLFNQI